MKRWIVRPGDGATVNEIVARAAPNDRDAVVEGRVFVGRERVSDGERAVREGDVILVHGRRDGGESGPVVLFSRDGVVAASKPAHVATVPDHRGVRGTLVDRVARELGCDPTKLHATSRLDVGVSGVVLFARTTEARERLQNAREKGSYERRYVAIATRAPTPPLGVWTWRIGRARDPRLRVVDGRDATNAESRYATLAVTPQGAAMLLLRPLTGRTHQLRLHASHAGSPLYGDPAYGGPTHIVRANGAVLRLTRIALHAAFVRVGDLTARVEPPADVLAIWTALDGDGEPWKSALLP